MLITDAMHNSRILTYISIQDSQAFRSATSPPCFLFLPPELHKCPFRYSGDLLLLMLYHYSSILSSVRDIYTRKWHSLQMIKLLEQWDSVKQHIRIITWLDIRSQLEKEVISSNGLLTHSLSVSISVGVLTGSVRMCVCWHREQSCSGTAWRCYWAAKVARTIPVVSKFILYVFFTRRFVLRSEAVPLVCVFQWSHVMDVNR